MADDKTPFPPGPYTEEQLQQLERGWHGRPTMRTVVGELRRLMAAPTAWPCGFPQPVLVTDSTGAESPHIQLWGNELSLDDAAVIGSTLTALARLARSKT